MPTFLQPAPLGPRSLPPPHPTDALTAPAELPGDPAAAVRAAPNERDRYPGEHYRQPLPITVPPAWATPQDREWYVCHEEENMSEKIRHSQNKNFTYFTIAAQGLPRFTIIEMELYPDQGSSRHVIPDLMVTGGPPADADGASYLAWSDPPIHFILEVVSARNTRAHLQDKRALYERLRVTEYLEHDPYRRTLHLWRLSEGQYAEAPADARDRYWSEETQLFYSLDGAGDLRREDEHGQECLLPDAQAARLAEETQQRELAEARAAAADARATEEARRRAALEVRLAEMEARLARLAELEAKLARAGETPAAGADPPE